ncbi:MAG: sarcosine oxidase subunit alpha family protein [Kiloniellales bacterium]
MVSRQPFRLETGGLIDRSRPLSFRFDGHHMRGYAGDSLAAALLANGDRLLGRSFKYHRPRGLLTAGSAEPSALVELREGARREPNSSAPMVELYEALTAQSQNRWPSLSFDLMAVNGLLSPLFPAGFYYKTFMWPERFWEPVYERVIRRAAGLGRAAREPDPDRYEKANAHCDVLVAGGGPAGLMAAWAAVQAGARVILCDEHWRLGGSLLQERNQVDGRAGALWAEEMVAHLTEAGVRVMPRTTVVGWYDGNTFTALERVADHHATPPQGKPRQRLWRLVARQVVIASGALERPLTFPDNDRPGVMLASAARTYVNRYAVKPGERAVVFGNNDDVYRTASDLRAAGIEVAAVVDARTANGGDARDEAAKPGHVVTGTSGKQLHAVWIAPRNGGPETRIACDLLCVAGGWNPVVHLPSQRGFRPVWDAARACFLPAASEGEGYLCAGAMTGQFALDACLAEGAGAGQRAAERCGRQGAQVAVPAANSAPVGSIEPLWRVTAGKRGGKAFVDLQNDVTADDVALAAREGYRSVEHLKRYTTLGMATDQGKTANVNGLALLAEALGKPIPEVGTTTFRPPYTPVAMGALAGAARGKHWRPTRLTPLHAWAEEQGAVFVESGYWLRAQYYPKKGEDWREARDREVKTVRSGVGLCDVSTLGKIEVMGPDAAAFLDLVYCNVMGTLPVGKARYGLMLREDGVVLDDGTTSRLGQDHFFMTTTTAEAAEVLAHLDFCRQAQRPQLDVRLTAVTDNWAAIAIAGPRARDLTAAVVEGLDLSNEAFPFLAAAEVTVLGGVPARLLRVSFSGELAYELYVPADAGDAAVRALMAAGLEHDTVPYGLEALGTMRIEKGHVAGSEVNGFTTADDLGLGRMQSKKKPDYIGRVLTGREGLTDPARQVVVGLRAVAPEQAIIAGAHLLPEGAAATVEHDQGYVTAVTWSPTLDTHIALALLSRGRARHGERLRAASPLHGSETLVEVVDPVFYDPEAARVRA